MTAARIPRASGEDTLFAQAQAYLDGRSLPHAVVHRLALAGANALLAKQRSMDRYRTKNRDKTLNHAKEWQRKHPERYAINKRMGALRRSIATIGDRAATSTTNWPLRVQAYREELEKLEKRWLELASEVNDATVAAPQEPANRAG